MVPCSLAAAVAELAPGLPETAAEAERIAIVAAACLGPSHTQSELEVVAVELAAGAFAAAAAMVAVAVGHAAAVVAAAFHSFVAVEVFQSSALLAAV